MKISSLFILYFLPFRLICACLLIHRLLVTALFMPYFNIILQYRWIIYYCWWHYSLEYRMFNAQPCNIKYQFTNNALTILFFFLWSAFYVPLHFHSNRTKLTCVSYCVNNFRRSWLISSNRRIGYWNTIRCYCITISHFW